MKPQERIRPAYKEDPVRAAQAQFGRARRERSAERERENLISALRGLPETASRATQTPASKIGAAIQRLMSAYRSPAPSFEKRLAQNWDAVIGNPRDASRCSLSRIGDDGSLIVSVHDAVLRSELQFQKPQILARVRALAGGKHVRGIVFRMG